MMTAFIRRKFHCMHLQPIQTEGQIRRPIRTRWRTQRGEVRGFNSNPPMNLQNFFNNVFVEYTVQAVFIYSLNPKFSTGKR